MEGWIDRQGLSRSDPIRDASLNGNGSISDISIIGISITRGQGLHPIIQITACLRACERACAAACVCACVCACVRACARARACARCVRACVCVCLRAPACVIVRACVLGGRLMRNDGQISGDVLGIGGAAVTQVRG